MELYVDGDGDKSAAERAEQRGRIQEAISQENRDPVPSLQTEGSEPVGDGGSRIGALAIGLAMGAETDGRPVLPGQHRIFEERENVHLPSRLPASVRNDP